MINKKAVYFIIFLTFFFSFSLSYILFQNKEKVISPLAFGDKGSKDVKDNFFKKNVVHESKIYECPLNGELHTKTQKNQWEKRRPLGVMIENHEEARPQSGLSSADIIYEIVAEGGITRFLAIYYCKDAAYVGPVRSARIYFVKILEGFGDYPLYAHVGGANTPGPADALGYIKTIGWSLYNDLNQFSVPFPYFWRDYERLPGRATEHTVYSSTIKLWQYAKDKRSLTDIDSNGNQWNTKFIPWKFRDDASYENRGAITRIDFGFWTTFASQYSVEWFYNKEKNVYLRNNGGQAHIDKNTGKQLESKNVIIIFAQESPANDGYEGGHLIYNLTGSGDVLVFHDGEVLKGTWKRESNKELFRFYDSGGKEINLVRGQIFVEVLPIGNKVNYF